MAAAAALQNRLWSFTDAFYAGQGQENSGYVTDEYLARASAGAGIDVLTARRERDTPEAARILRAASSEAQRLGVQSTPSFFLRRGDGALRPLKVSRLTPDAFTAALDDSLAAR